MPLTRRSVTNTDDRSRPSLRWKRIAESPDITGISAAELRAIGKLWKNRGHEFTAHFSGRSMTPTIAPGTDLNVRCTDEVQIGDVIVYVYLDQVVLHRVVAGDRRWVLTRGDAHVIPDDPVLDRQDIIGVVRGMVGSGGELLPIPNAPASRRHGMSLFAARLGATLGVRGLVASLRLQRIVAAAVRSLRSAW